MATKFKNKKAAMAFAMKLQTIPTNTPLVVLKAKGVQDSYNAICDNNFCDTCIVNNPTLHPHCIFGLNSENMELRRSNHTQKSLIKACRAFAKVLRERIRYNETHLD
jgi:hypothetical protein